MTSTTTSLGSTVSAMGNVPDSDNSEIESWFPKWKMKISEFPRYRSVTVYPDRPLVVVRTRTGGGNRSGYDKENQNLRELQGFNDDEDDNFDNTFAYWHYTIPEKSRDAWKAYCARQADNPPGPEQKVVVKTDWALP